MDAKVRARMERAAKMAAEDPQYQRMLMEIRAAEKKYNHLLSTMPMEEQNIIFDFVSLCEEMSWRMLELACEIDDKSPPE